MRASRALCGFLLSLVSACGGGSGGAGPGPAAPPATPSADATLAALVPSVGSLAPAFDPAVASFTASVPPGTAQATLTPTAAHPAATLSVAGTAVASGLPSPPLPLAGGADTEVEVVVTAQDGVTRRSYRVTFHREPAGPADPWPRRLFAPYVDAGLWPTLGALTDEVLDTRGVKRFHLAFVVEDGWTPLVASWAGVYQVGSSDAVTGDAAFVAGIERLRAHGGDAILSFGGATGKELAVAYSQAGKTAAELQQAYQAVIDRYALTYVDFDVEGAFVADAASIALRSAALRGLQDAAASAGRLLHVSLTLPVLPTGLTPDGLAVVQSALAAGVTLDCVNVMCMDYGSNTADMGKAATDAGASVVAQLAVLAPGKTLAEIRRMVGLTPMIGLNDTAPETFTLADAATVKAWAEANDIRLLSMWSLNRDHPGSGLSPTHSGISQDDLAFCEAFKPFAP